jgi:hypothetical protein
MQVTNQITHPRRWHLEVIMQRLRTVYLIFMAVIFGLIFVPPVAVAQQSLQDLDEEESFYLN